MTWDDLSRREKQVIALAAYGLHSHQIAVVLGINQRTVEVYRLRGRNNLGLPPHADLALILDAYWPEIVRAAAPEMRRYLERAIGHLDEHLVLAEQEIIARQTR